MSKPKPPGKKHRQHEQGSKGDDDQRETHITSIQENGVTGHVALRPENEPSVDDDGFFGIGIDAAVVIEPPDELPRRQ